MRRRARRMRGMSRVIMAAIPVKIPRPSVETQMTPLVAKMSMKITDTWNGSGLFISTSTLKPITIMKRMMGKRMVEYRFRVASFRFQVASFKLKIQNTTINRYFPPHHPITPSPHHPITPSPHHPITPSPHHPITPFTSPAPSICSS